MGESMKKIFILFTVVLISMVVIFLIITSNNIINKKYYINNNKYYIEIDYPYFNNKNIDEYIDNYLEKEISSFKYKVNNYGYMYLDYDYKVNNNNIEVIFYKYFNIDNKVNINSIGLNLNNNKLDIKTVNTINTDLDISQSNNIDINKKMVAITFDDGPNYNTSKILEIFKKYNVRATFFVLGSKIEGNEKILKLMNEYNMEIGNHTYSHKLLTKMDNEHIIKEVKDTNELIYNVVGKYPRLVRPSYGSFNKKIKENIGMPIIIWNIDTLDWKNHNSNKIVSRIMNEIDDGDIILMHDIYSATVNAVDIVVPKLINEGYQIVGVSELFYYKNIKLKNGNVYGKAG